VGAAGGGCQRQRHRRRTAGRSAGRGKPAQGRAGRRVAAVHRQVPLCLRQEHGRQATLLAASHRIASIARHPRSWVPFGPFPLEEDV